MLGDKADILIDKFAEDGMTTEMRNEFFTLGTKVFDNINKMLIKSKATIKNLEEKKDWNKIIR